MSWRAGAKLFRDIWPLVQTNIPHPAAREAFMRDLLKTFANSDLDLVDLRRMHPEIDSLLDELCVGQG